MNTLFFYIITICLLSLWGILFTIQVKGIFEFSDSKIGFKLKMVGQGTFYLINILLAFIFIFKNINPFSIYSLFFSLLSTFWFCILFKRRNFKTSMVVNICLFIYELMVFLIVV